MWQQFFITIAVFLSFCLGGASLTQEQVQYIAQASGTQKLSRYLAKGSIEPEGLYRKVWQLIREDYYDLSYNTQSWDRWEHRYDGKLKTLEDSHKAIETMLASLGDRYTRFLDHDAFDDEKSQIDAKLYGIGVQIGIKNDRVIVIAPLDGTPAQKAGLMALDEIAEIDGRPTKGFSVEDAAKLIRGTINTRVILTLRRSGQKIRIAVTRAEIPIKAVQSAQMLDHDIGYIRLSSFISQQANKEMREAISSLPQAKGLILDLRDNPGGLLTNAIDISNMFLSSGGIVSTVDRDGYKTEAQSDGRPICKLPLIVLINKGSASASEITSGALKDNGRAMLVGQKTFGKGLVQGINRLDDGSGVNVTIARYLTPNDTDINKKGILPDIAIELNDKDYKSGNGPWWLDPEGTGAKRSPGDLKDIQLKEAFTAARKRLAENSPPVASRPVEH